jgi:hypothetical protein
MKTTFTTLLLAGVMSIGAACTTDEATDNLGEAAQAATATTLATRCVNRIGAKRATVGKPTYNVNEWPTNGQGTFTQCGAWAAWQDHQKNIAHYTWNQGFICGGGFPGGGGECLRWNKNSSQTMEAQVDACVDALWADPPHRKQMEAGQYASCGVYDAGTSFTLNAYYRNQ